MDVAAVVGESYSWNEPYAVPSRRRAVVSQSGRQDLGAFSRVVLDRYAAAHQRQHDGFCWSTGDRPFTVRPVDVGGLESQAAGPLLRPDTCMTRGRLLRHQRELFSRDIALSGTQGSPYVLVVGEGLEQQSGRLVQPVQPRGERESTQKFHHFVGAELLTLADRPGAGSVEREAGGDQGAEESAKTGLLGAEIVERQLLDGPLRAQRRHAPLLRCESFQEPDQLVVLVPDHR